MDCARFRAELLDVLEGGAPGPAFAAHRTTCGSCRVHAEEVEALDRVLSNWPREAAPSWIWGRVREGLDRPAARPRRLARIPRPLRVAAVFLLLATGVAILSWPRSPAMPRHRLVLVEAEVNGDSPELELFLNEYVGLDQDGRTRNGRSGR